MTAVRIIGIVLTAAGVLGLVYGAVTFTKDTQTVDLCVAEVGLKEKSRVQIPVWAGVISIVFGCLLVF